MHKILSGDKECKIGKDELKCMGKFMQRTNVQIKELRSGDPETLNDDANHELKNGNYAIALEKYTSAL